MTPTEAQVEAGARAICIAAGDDPDKITYAHEMKCANHDREPRERWQYWIEFSRACLTAGLSLTRPEGKSL